MSAASLSDDLLLAAAEDWVHFAQVSWFAKHRAPDASHVDRVVAAVDAIRSLLDHDPQPGDVAWLANTQRGDRAAAELS